jgi:hypothetical protein
MTKNNLSAPTPNPPPNPARPPAQSAPPEKSTPPEKSPPPKKSAPPEKKQTLQFGNFSAAIPEFSINEVPRPAPDEILHTGEITFKNGAVGRLSFILSADKKHLRDTAFFIHKLPENFSFDEMKSFDKTDKPVNLGESNEYSLFDDMVKIKNLTFSGGAVTADIGVVFRDFHSGQKQDIGETPVSFSYFIGKIEDSALIFFRPRTASKTSAAPAAKETAVTTINVRLVHESKPRAQKEVHLVWYNLETKKWEGGMKTTDKDGLVSFTIPQTEDGASHSFFVDFSLEKAAAKSKLADAGKILLYRAPAGTPALELQMNGEEITGEENNGMSVVKGSVQLWRKE